MSEEAMFTFCEIELGCSYDAKCLFCNKDVIHFAMRRANFKKDVGSLRLETPY